MGRRYANAFLLKTDSTLVSDDALHSVARQLEEDFWFANDGRVFFKTANGYIGSGPPGTVVDDFVMLVFGSAAPFVLRSVEHDPPELVNASPKPCYKMVGGLCLCPRHHGRPNGSEGDCARGRGREEVRARAFPYDSVLQVTETRSCQAILESKPSPASKTRQGPAAGLSPPPR
jgi:hypothetical protein